MTSESPELKLFRDTTRQLLAESASGEALRAMYSSEVFFDKIWWERAADLGWTALLVPEALGGGSVTGSGIADLMVVAREFGCRTAPGPLFAASAVLAGLVEYTNADEHIDTIEHIMAGKVVPAWAFAGDRVPRSTQPGFHATPSSDGFIVDGIAERVEAAAQADILLVPATTSDGVVQLLVSPTSDGVSITSARSVDIVRQFATVRLTNVVVPSAALVGNRAETVNVMRRQCQIAVLLRCAETVGVMSTAFDMTLQWAFDRYSFGRSLASYQALKHRYASMFMWIQAAEAITDAAAVAVHNRDPRADVLLSAAKSYVGERATEMLHDCIQLHGGIGVTWEHDLHLYLRRAAIDTNTFGTPEDHQLWLAEHAGREQAR
jgi:alkylation response protein AidB-like acyl-CoA dehydrogenase